MLKVSGNDERRGNGQSSPGQTREAKPHDSFSSISLVHGNKPTESQVSVLMSPPPSQIRPKRPENAYSKLLSSSHKASLRHTILIHSLRNRSRTSHFTVRSANHTYPSSHRISSSSSSSSSRSKAVLFRSRALFSEFPADHIDTSDLQPIVARIKQKEAAVLEAWAADHPTALTRYKELSERMRQKEEMEKLLAAQPTEAPTQSLPNRLSSLKQGFINRFPWRASQSPARSEVELKNERLEQLYRSLVFVSPNETICDGCMVPSSSKTVNKLPDEGIRLWVGDEEQPNRKPDEHSYYHSSETPLEITAIYVSMINRLDFLQQLLYRWRGWL